MLLEILSWIVFGLVVGAIARLLVPGPQSLGLIGTMLLGIAGSFLGGFAVYLISGGDAIQGAGWIASIIGAVVLVMIGEYTQRRRVTH